jgi:hypothetical protein
MSHLICLKFYALSVGQKFCTQINQVNQVKKELKLLWPGVVLVNGKPSHPQSQGSVEQANDDITKML